MHRKTGSTLIEIIIVIIILGALTIIATPRFTLFVEKGQAMEAYPIFAAVRSAQLAYKVENGVFSDDVNELEVDIDIPDYFSGLLVYDGTATASNCNNPPDIVNYIAILNGRYGEPKEYNLFLGDEGDVICRPTGGCSAPNLCPKLGF